jgi:lysyl-tRNA synthetase class 2
VNARGQRLRQRAAALRAVREFFADRGYLEIDAPIAVVSPGLEPHLDAFELARPVGARRYLHTSPEYALKRALGEGLSRIYWLGSCFRDETPSATHSPEFTMLEWYGVGLSQEALMDETAALVAAVCRAVRGSHEAVIERNGRLLDLGAQASA